ncbi:MAG: hypothetical protein ACP5PV_02740 [Methanothrix sp.]
MHSFEYDHKKFSLGEPPIAMRQGTINFASDYKLHPILHLQTKIGNRAVQRLIVQARHTISHPGNKFEQTVDQIAEEMVRMPKSWAISETELDQPLNIQRFCRKCRTNGARRPGEDKGETPQAKEIPGQVPEARSKIRGILPSSEYLYNQTNYAFMEAQFTPHFSELRMNADVKNTESMKRARALANIAEQNLVSGAGQHVPMAEQKHFKSTAYANSLRYNFLNVMRADCDVNVDPRDYYTGYLTRSSFRTVGRGMPVITVLDYSLQANQPCIYDMVLAHERQHVANSRYNCRLFKRCVMDFTSRWTGSISYNHFSDCQRRYNNGIYPNCLEDEWTAYTSGIIMGTQLLGEPRCSAERQNLERQIRYSENIRNNPPNCRGGRP